MSFSGRSISEIYNQIITEKETKTYLTGLQPNIDTHQNFLDDLSSESKVAIWRSFVWIVSFCVFMFEKIMETYREDVDYIIENSYIGSVKWYIAKALQFQSGRSVVFNQETYTIGYETDDPESQIIEFAAGEENSGILYLKVRRVGGAQLSENEMSEFTSYINQIKFAGCRIIIKNDLSDYIKLYMTILYNPEYDLDTLKSNVYAVIEDYIENIEFNSKFKVNSLIDRLQDVEGVMDPQLNWTDTKVKSRISDYIAITYQYQSIAGWLEVDPSYPLTSTITFVKNT